MMKRPPRQSKKPGGDALDRTRAANPAGATLLDQNQVKADLAMALRSIRKAKGMTQAEVRRASVELGRPLTQLTASKLEGPTGALPNLEAIVRYAAACGAHVELSFIFGRDETGVAFKVVSS